MRSLLVGAGLLAMLLSGCGGGLSGRYENHGGSASFTFKGNSVEIEALGQIQVGEYKLEDGKVYISNAGQTAAMRIDGKGCIDGGFMFGTLCKS